MQEIATTITVLVPAITIIVWAYKALAAEEQQRALYITNATKAAKRALDTIHDPQNTPAIKDLIARGKLDVKIK